MKPLEELSCREKALVNNLLEAADDMDKWAYASEGQAYPSEEMSKRASAIRRELIRLGMTDGTKKKTSRRNRSR